MSVALGLEAPRQVQQKGSEAFLAIHATQQQHQTVLTHDLPDHQAANQVPCAAAGRRYLRLVGIGNGTDVGVFRRCNSGAMFVVGNANQADCSSAMRKPVTFSRPSASVKLDLPYRPAQKWLDISELREGWQSRILSWPIRQAKESHGFAE